MTLRVFMSEGLIPVEMVEITHPDGSITQMTKAHWDELEAKREQSETLS